MNTKWLIRYSNQYHISLSMGIWIFELFFLFGYLNYLFINLNVIYKGWNLYLSIIWQIFATILKGNLKHHTVLISQCLHTQSSNKTSILYVQSQSQTLPALINQLKKNKEGVSITKACSSPNKQMVIRHQHPQIGRQVSQEIARDPFTRTHMISLQFP